MEWSGSWPSVRAEGGVGVCEYDVTAVISARVTDQVRLDEADDQHVEY